MFSALDLGNSLRDNLDKMFEVEEKSKLECRSKSKCTKGSAMDIVHDEESKVIGTQLVSEEVEEKNIDPWTDIPKALLNGYVLDTPVRLDNEDISSTTKLSNYLFVVEASRRYFVSLVLNPDLIEAMEKRCFITLLCRRKCKDIFYDCSFG